MTTLALTGAGNAEVFAALRQLGYTTKEVHDAYLPSPTNAIRVCTHVFSSEEQVDGLLAALQQALDQLTAA